MIRPSKQFDGMSVTICTTFDCNLRCKYDVAKGTKITVKISEVDGKLVSEYKNVEDLSVNDKISAFMITGSMICEPTDGKIYDITKTRSLTSYYHEKKRDLYLSAEHPWLIFNNEEKQFSFLSTAEVYDIFKKGEFGKKYYTFVRLQNEQAVGDYHWESEFVAYVPDIEFIDNGPELEFYNMTTSTRTFIANDVLVHNCYELNKRAVRINENTVYKFIDRILEDPDPIGAAGTEDEWITKTGIIIDFIGGDSFMQPDLIDKALTYFIYKANALDHPYKNKWRANISSNGTLFGDPRVQELIRKYQDNFNIGVSIDGCPEIHDANRIFTMRGKNGEELGTMSTIMKWWPWLAERNPEAVKVTKATCSKNSIPWLYKSLKFMHEPYPKGLGIVYINQNFIMEDTGCEEDDYVLLNEMYRKCSKYLFDHRHEMYWSMFDTQGLNRRSDNVEEFKSSIKKGWCGSGAMPSIGLNGKIYPCFRWLPHTMEAMTSDADEFCVGTADKGFIWKENFRRVKEATREKISSQYCMECEYEGACAYCIGGCYSEFHKFKRTEHICYITKLRSVWARRYWDMVEELEHNHFDYFNESVNETRLKVLGDSNKSVFTRKDMESSYKYGDDGKLKPEYRTPDNPTGEPQLTIPDLPKEYRNAWKYSPKQQIGEGEEFMDNKKIIPKDNLGRETPV